MSVGASPARIDAPAKLTGAATYPSDRIPPDALWAMAVFTDQPHARLISLDLEAARAVEGVVAVFGSADVPVNEFGLTMADHPVFVGLEHTVRSHLPCDVSRWEADRLALVVAETPDAARAGAAAIESQWEPLPVLADIDQSLSSSTMIHPENGEPSNAYYSLRIRKGDMDQGWADADVVVESTYEFPYQEHAYLQPEAGMAYIDGEGRVTVEVAGQWTHEDQEQIAHALDLPAERVRVIYPAIGGAFGGREDISVQIVLGLAAMKLHERGIDRPVATVWSREESIVGHGKRHRGRITARWGARRDGRITAVSSTAWLDAGAYNFTSNKVLGNCHLHQAGPYEVPNAEIDSIAVYTNATPAGAFRGFGAPQAAFAAESQINKLAEALGMDPVEIRRINTLREGSVGITQTAMPDGVTMPEVIDRCAEAAAEPSSNGEGAAFSPFPSLPPEPSALRRGRGFACSFKNVGFSFGFPERCEAEIVLRGGQDSDVPERAELYHAGAEVGQGAHTALVQMAAEATGLPADRIESTGSVTRRPPATRARRRRRGSRGCRATPSWARPRRPRRPGGTASDRLRAASASCLRPPSRSTPVDGHCVPNFSYGYVAQHVELTVDTGTGHIRVDRVVSAHDVGRAINPDLVVGQIEGAVIQAHGYALSENLQSDGGRLQNMRLSTYLMPGIGDIPTTVDSVVLELADPLGPWGARGMAEMGMIPYAPAVTAALHDATGVWFDSFPLTPDRVLAGLRRAEG